MKFRTNAVVALLYTAVVAFALAASPSATERRLTGEYSYTSGGNSLYDVDIYFSVWREGDTMVIGFQGAHPMGNGAAPDGAGKGRIDSGGILRFDYEDSFFNKGHGTFRWTKTGYKLSIDIADMRESRCAMFYGDFVLKRVSSKPRRS
jgi:hypothetical protein